MAFKTVLWAACIMILALSACAAQPVALTADEQAAFQKISEPLADNMLAGLNQKDYATFSKNFDEPMQSAMDEKQFNLLLLQVTDKIGEYQSRQIVQMLRISELVQVTYLAQFSQEKDVTIRITYEFTGAHNVAGLWFDSPTLRRK